jgi:hypothetical protein
MADKTPLGMEFANWQNVPSISESFARAASGQFNPLMYAAGYALDKLAGSSDVSQQMMSKKPVQPPAPTGMGQGLNTQMAPSVPPNGGLGLAAPSQPMFDYKPQTDVMSQPSLTQPSVMQPAQQPNVLDAWKTLSFNGLNKGQ